MRITKKIDNKPPLLFLDFDGVCNSYAEGSYKTNKEDTYGPSKTICKRLRNFCERTGTRIIISSNWRKFETDGFYVFDGNRVFNPLRKLKNLLGKCMIGTLPPVRYVPKSEALILWIEENDYDSFSGKWAIVDDDPRENLGYTEDYDIKYHYVQTDPEFGLTEEKLKEVEEKIFQYNNINIKHKDKKEDES